jgi:hypothetical protein
VGAKGSIDPSAKNRGAKTRPRGWAHRVMSSLWLANPVSSAIASGYGDWVRRTSSNERGASSDYVDNPLTSVHWTATQRWVSASCAEFGKPHDGPHCHRWHGDNARGGRAAAQPLLCMVTSEQINIYACQPQRVPSTTADHPARQDGARRQPCSPINIHVHGPTQLPPSLDGSECVFVEQFPCGGGDNNK